MLPPHRLRCGTPAREFAGIHEPSLGLPCTSINTDCDYPDEVYWERGLPLNDPASQHQRI
jgi:hypothetical protein